MPFSSHNPYDLWGESYTTLCDECEDVVLFRGDCNWGNCGDCGKVMCSDCMENMECEVCNDRHSRDEHPKTEGPACCQECDRSCPDCEDLVLHSCCIAEHMRDCPKTSRAQRLVFTSEESIKQKAADLRRAKSQLSSVQRRIRTLEGEIAEAEKTKATAEPEKAKEQYQNKRHCGKRAVSVRLMQERDGGDNHKESSELEPHPQPGKKACTAR